MRSSNLRHHRPLPSRGPESRNPAGERPFPRVAIAATASGAGKTSVTAGLLGAMAARGARVAPFKCGPDFLDPQVLRGAAGSATASNLDRWLTSDTPLAAGLRRHGRPGPDELNLIEGGKGVLDTSSWRTSTADIAIWLGAPIVLVVDASRSAESVALQVRGARELLPRDLFAGVIVNRVGRGWHAAAVRQWIEGKSGVPVVGMLPWSPDIGLPERHFGLATPRTQPEQMWTRKFRALREWVAEGVNLDLVREIARRSAPFPGGGDPRTGRGVTRKACLAVASDAAFCFTYPENLEAFADRGGQVEMFSPLAGDALPPAADVVYLPGGYPELHAQALSHNEGLRRELRGWVRDGRPLLAECGGMMYLLDRLVDVKGAAHRMVGAFRGSTSMQPRLVGIGYGEAHLRRTSILGRRGQRLRAHIYHHSRREAPTTVSWGWRYEPRSGAHSSDDGLLQGRAVASHLHLRLDGYPHIVSTMMEGRR
jgi:cobyrinic acid a,c-diamide synthase